MSEKSIVITEKDGNYQIKNSALSEYELLGLLEQIIFDLKFSKIPKNENTESAAPEILPQAQAETTAPVAKSPSEPEEKVGESAPEDSAPTSKNPASAELKTRIGNAIKAIKDLGGKVENADLNKMSAEELQTELEELTAQYKRLKAAKS